jgi:hypothetical protein
MEKTLRAGGVPIVDGTVFWYVLYLSTCGVSELDVFLEYQSSGLGAQIRR